MAWVAALPSKGQSKGTERKLPQTKKNGKKKTPLVVQPCRCRGLPQGARGWYLAQGLRSPVPCGMAKKKKLSTPTYKLTLEACKHLWEV